MATTLRGQPQCAGVCQAVEAGHIKLTSLKQDGCDLNWGLETDNDNVVFIYHEGEAHSLGDGILLVCLLF